MSEYPKDPEYRDMESMQNHIWSIIKKQVKHNYTYQSKQGRNNLAKSPEKILTKRYCTKLYKVTEKLKSPIFSEEKAEETAVMTTF